MTTGNSRLRRSDIIPDESNDRGNSRRDCVTIRQKGKSLAQGIPAWCRPRTL